MQTVLIIDDIAASANVVVEAIRSEFPDVTCEVENSFEAAVAQIAKLNPDAIVLDLMKGAFSTDLPGQQSWKTVWDIAFCPIVIYSASEAELEPAVPADHPFVKRITKGSGTVPQVVQALKSFAPAVRSVKVLEAEVEAVIRKVLRDTANHGMPITEPAHFLHASRRRIAAEMDGKTVTGERQMVSWEQYLIPAIGDSPLTADILRKRGDPADDATAYRLVLTPSCDLVKGRCVKTVLVANCQKGTELVSRMSLSVKPSDLVKSVDRLCKNALSGGVFEGYVPLPSFGGRIPHLVANLKNLDLISYESIDPADQNQPGFDRVASIDSPFREQVAWAYLTTSARPGMPDRELKAWAEELIKNAAAEKTASPSNAR